jgi:hypothetical protein
MEPIRVPASQLGAVLSFFKNGKVGWSAENVRGSGNHPETEVSSLNYLYF